MHKVIGDGERGKAWDVEELAYSGPHTLPIASRDQGPYPFSCRPVIMPGQDAPVGSPTYGTKFSMIGPSWSTKPFGQVLKVTIELHKDPPHAACK